MKKIFLDCGFYRGVALRQYADRGIVDKSWAIYAFEANPDLNTKQHIADFFPDLPVKLVEKAVWINTKPVAFHISGRDDAASIAGTSGHTEPKEVTAKAMDFSKFVSKLPEAYIVCSMDIEGAEYEVLDKMINDGSIDRLNELDIEFHHRLMNDYDETSSQGLIDNILSRGIKLRLKVPLR